MYVHYEGTFTWIWQRFTYWHIKIDHVLGKQAGYIICTIGSQRDSTGREISISLSSYEQYDPICFKPQCV